MAAAFVQATANATDTAGATQATAAFGSNTTTGNAIFVIISWDDTTPRTVNSVSDSAGNTYTVIGTKFVGANLDTMLMYVKENITGGSSVTVSFTLSGTAGFKRIVAHEASGIALSGSFDKDSAGSEASTSSLTDTAVTTTANGEYIFSAVMNDSGTAGTTESAGAGFTEPANSTAVPANNEMMAEFQIQTSAGSISGTFTQSAATHAIMRTATFKAAGGATDLTNYWYAPWREPVRAKPPYPRAAWYMPFTMDARWTPPTIFAGHWYKQWQDPPAHLQKKSVPWQMPFATDSRWIPPDVRMSSWFQNWREPVRKVPRAAHFEYFTTDWRWIPPTIYAANWYTQWQDPIRAKKGIAWQDPATDVFQQTDLFWYWQWPDLPRKKPSISHLTPFDVDWYNPVVVTVTYNWFSPLAEPARAKPYPAENRNWLTVDLTTVTINYNWFSPLTEPVRVKPYPVENRNWFYVDPTTVTINYNWFSPLGDPVRIKPRAVERGWYTADLQPPATVTWGWFGQLSERPKVGKQSTPWYQDFTMDWRWSPPTVIFSFAPLAEPVRFKKSVPWQAPFTTDWQWTPPAVRVSSWFQEFRTRPPPKAGMHASRQMFFQMDWKWSAPVIQNITYSFSILETGDFGAFVFLNPAEITGAHVSMTEDKVGWLAVVTITEVDD